MTVGAEGDRTKCPVCRSERVEALDTVPDGFTHRCFDCGAEFDSTGGRVNPSGETP